MDRQSPYTGYLDGPGTAKSLTSSPNPMIQVVHFQRQLGPRQFSIERIFSDVRKALLDDISVRIHENPALSNHPINLIRNGLSARAAQGSVNHIVGDAHYLALFLSPSRTVLTIHDCVSLERLRGPKKWIFWLLWYRIPLALAKKVTVVSAFTKAQLEYHVGPYRSDIEIIPPTCSPEFGGGQAKPLAATPTLLVVGTGKNKNLERLVQACEGLDVRLSIIGPLDADQSNQLKAAKLEYENSMNLSVQELVDKYRGADILAFASTYEGFGMPIVEAQSLGIPVLTSNVCSMPEAAGGAACLVDPFDVGSIRSGLERLLGDEAYRTELVERGLKNAQLFTASAVAARYAKVYRAVADSHGSGNRPTDLVVTNPRTEAE